MAMMIGDIWFVVSGIPNSFVKNFEFYKLKYKWNVLRTHSLWKICTLYHLLIDRTISRKFLISNIFNSISIIWLLQKMNEITTHIHGINYEARIWRPENDLQYKKNISSITTRVASFYPWQKRKEKNCVRREDNTNYLYKLV